MKIKPEVFLNSNKNIIYNKILVTGSDESFISYVKNFIVEEFKKKGFFIDYSNNYKDRSIGNLFSEKKSLFVLSDFPANKEISHERSDDKSILVASPNGKKTNLIKKELSKDKESLVVECYSLNRSSKESFLKNYIEKNNLTFSYDVFWYVVDNFDNNYVIFIKQLQMLSLFNKEIV